MLKRKIKTNGISLAVYEYSHSGEAVLFLHYVLGNAAIWNGVIPYFQHDYRTIAIDLRGHGASDQPETGYGIKAMCDDILGVMDHLELQRVHLVGSSLGCYLATFFAATYPDRVHSIINCDGAMQNHSGPNGKFADSREDHLKKCILPEQTFESAADFIRAEKERVRNWNTIRETAVLHGWVPTLTLLPNGEFARKTTSSTYQQIMASLYDLRLEPLYEKISCPVLFLPAANHRHFEAKNDFISHVRSLHSGFTKSVIIPETEHIMVFDHHREVSLEILHFLDECRLYQRQQI